MDSLKYYAAITAMCTLSFVPCHAEPVRQEPPQAIPSTQPAVSAPSAQAPQR